MIKKWTALLLALVLCGSLAACSGNTEAADDTAKKDEAVETIKLEDGEAAQPEADKDTPDSDKAEASETGKGSTSSSGGTTGSTGGGTSGSTGSASSGNSASNTGSGTTAPSTGNSTASKPQETPAPAPAPEPEPEPEPEPAAPTAAQASAYIGGSASAVVGALGSPNSKSYSPSCMGEGEDGIWNYGSFTVYTYRENGSETVEAVQ